MAGVGVCKASELAMTALLLSAGTLLFAQSPTPGGGTGGLAGKLTDLHSHPLAATIVVLRNQATGAETRTTTEKNGAYRFSGLEPGEYTLAAESAEFGRGQVEDIVVDAGHEARVQSALEFAPADRGELLATLRAGRRQIIEPGAAPTMEAGMDAEPLQGLRLLGRRISDVSGLSPEPTTAVLNAPLAALPLRTMEVAGRPAPADSRDSTGPLENPALEASNVLPRPAATSESTVRTAVTAARPNLERVALAATAKAAFTALRGVQAESRLMISMVRADGPMSRGTASPLSTTLSGEQLQALPVSGRHWENFVLERPASPAAADDEEQSPARGSGEKPEAVSVEGASSRMAFGGTGWTRGHGAALGEAAVRQVESAAGSISVQTQRGGNGLHGQGFLFDRQNMWGARNPFTQWVKETAPATPAGLPTFTPEPYSPPSSELTWGFGVGRHIRRNRLFWFAALDDNQRNDPAVSTVRHPDVFFAQPANDQMQVLSARLGLSSVNPVAAGIGAYSSMLETLDGMLGPAPRSSTQWTGFGRIDWEATERHRFTFEGTGASASAPGGGLTRVSETYGSHSFGSSQASQVWLLGRWEAFLSPNLLAVTQGSMGRNLFGARPETPSAFEQTLNTNAWGRLPQIVVDSRYGFTIGNPSRFGVGRYPDEHMYQGQESVDWVRGNLLVKAGFDLRHDADATTLLRNQTGSYFYASVENFASDALAFGAFGISGQLDPANQHNCDQTGRVWRDSTGQLRGLGYLPCYSYYSQTMGPADWHLSSNDWAGYATAQWQPARLMVLSAGVRWERQQLPPPIAALSNPDLPLTQHLPTLGNNWGPRLSLALGGGEGHWPVLQLGYGMYFGRTSNARLETAMTQTGSLKGDLNFFMRPTDNLNAGGAPPFPYVLAGEPLKVVKPGAVEFAPGFRNAEIHQAMVGVEEKLPGHLQVTASALISLGRRLPISIDTNFDPALNPGTITYGVVDESGKGPIKASQIVVPFYASWPAATSATGFGGRLNADYQQIAEIESRANSTYEAAMLRVVRSSRRGLTFHARYTYAHAMDWNPNESAQVASNDVLDPADLGLEYGTSNLDTRHAATTMVMWQAPWKLHHLAGKLGNGWTLSGIGQFHSGMPYTMRTAGSLAKEFDARTGAAIVGLAPGMNGSGGDNRIYGLGSDNRSYNVGRNTFRYPATWKADLRMSKRFNLGQMRQLELLAESFNLFNHQNVTQLETVGYSIEPGGLAGTHPTLHFLTGLKVNTTAFGQPLNINATDFYRERQIELGLRVRF